MTKTIEKFACRKTFEAIAPEQTEAYTACCRLVPTHKYPEVRPKGIGEVIRGMIGRNV